jgi:hypothetical protein
MIQLSYIVSKGSSPLSGMHMEGACRLHEPAGFMGTSLIETEHEVKTTCIRFDSWTESS